jgi:hypothetical protein
LEQESKEAHSKSTKKSGFFGPQKTAVPLLQGQKKLFLQL